MKNKGLFLLLPFFLSSCACLSPQEVQDRGTNDVLEPMNRVIFQFNMALDQGILEPLAKGARYVLPQFVRTGVSNFFSNLAQPVYLGNALLQGDGAAALTTGKRFVTNTFVGGLGFIDVATRLDIPEEKRDFGQTLAVWGIESSGPFLVLPILGPSTVRDSVGLVGDTALNPTTWILWDEPAIRYSLMGTEAFFAREKSIDFIDTLKGSSTDLYATMRTMYLQNRKNSIQKVLGEKNTDYEFDFELEE